MRMMMNKLKSRKGESIAEVLVALLLSAVGLVLLATMISSATRIVDQSKVALEHYVRQENLLALKQVSEDDSDPDAVTVTKSSGKLSSTAKLTEEMTEVSGSYTFDIHYYAASLGSKSVTAYS